MNKSDISPADSMGAKDCAASKASHPSPGMSVRLLSSLRSRSRESRVRENTPNLMSSHLVTPVINKHCLLGENPL